MNSDVDSPLSRCLTTSPLENLEAFTGISFKLLDQKIEHTQKFVTQKKYSSTVNFSGSIIGYLILSCDEDMAAQIIQAESSILHEAELDNFCELFNELANTVSGDISPILKESYPIITLSSPRISIGSLRFPPNPCIQVTLKTDIGELELCYGTDHMGLDVIELLEDVRHQKTIVSQQKTELKEILDHIDLLLLKIDRDGNILPGTSKKCTNVLGFDRLENQSFSNIIPCSDDVKLNFQEWIKACYVSYGKIHWGKLERLNPIQEVTIGNRNFVLNTIPIPEHDQLNKILIIGKDITDIKALQAQAQEDKTRHDQEIQIIRSLVSAPQRTIQIFLNECELQIKQLIEFLKNMDSNHSIHIDTFTEAKRSTHTLKGNASLYHLDIISEASHHCEMIFVNLIKEHSQEPKSDHFIDLSQEPIDITQDLRSKIHFLENEFNLVLNWASKLNIYENSDNYEPKISIGEWELMDMFNTSLKLLTHKETNPLHKELEVIHNFLHRQIHQPCRMIVPRLEEMAKQACFSEFKSEINFLVHGEELFFPSYILDKIISPLSHIIKNAIVHGIESDESRKMKKKDLPGTLTLSFIHKNNQWVIQISDDGKGVELDTIKNINDEKHRDDIDQNQQDLAEILSTPGFSTRKHHDHLAGAGVGLSIVRDNINHLGGTLNISSQKDNGCTINLSIPERHQEG
jgi:CheY-specific phosphatase CheX/HPt (histidine-containing phosphotransfer) domain-containing protein